MKKNKKWVVLLDAVIGIVLLFMCLTFMFYIIKVSTSIQTMAVSNITEQNIRRITTRVEYIKKRMVKMWKTTQNSKENRIYAGWDKLAITPNGEAIENLDGYYILEKECDLTDTGSFCLRKTTPGEWGYLRIFSFSRVNEEKRDGTLDKSGHLSNGSTAVEGSEVCEELAEDCIAYRIEFKNATTDKYKKITYKDSYWTTFDVHTAKTMTIELKKEENEKTIEKFNYILSLY